MSSISPYGRTRAAAARPRRTKAANLVKVSVTGVEATIRQLKTVGLTLRSPEVTREIQRGAEIMAAGVRRRVPVGATGNLRRGVYTASTLRNNFVQLTRPTSGRRVNDPLKFLRRGTVLVVSSTFYGLWVEKGRKARTADPTRARKHERRTVGLMSGRKRGRPFFRPGIKETQATAEAFIVRRLDRLIQQRVNGEK